MKKRVCVVTGSRAEYGLLFPILKKIEARNNLDLLLIATGTHLSREFGMTYKEIIKDGFKIDKKVKMLLPDNTDLGVTKSTGFGIIGFAEAFRRLKPDLVVLLGDRFEIFSAATAAYMAGIPIAHIHGGEVTAGSLDDSFRHSITKMSLLHFAATKEYKNRIVQLGEDPKRVFVVGAPAIDNIKHFNLLTKKELERNLNFSLGKNSIIVMFHPATAEKNSAKRQFKELLSALSGFKDLRIVFIFPNADADSRVIIKLINEFVKRNKRRAKAFASLGQVRYLSLIRHTKAVVGNSSSGIIEAPTFGKPAVNIGSRQDGRIKALSVIACRPEKEDIKRAIRKALSEKFAKAAKKAKNYYGDGKASDRIAKILSAKISKLGGIKKKFYDLKGK